MDNKQKRIILFAGIAVFVLAVIAIAFLTVAPNGEGTSRFFGTAWAFVPPVVAIVLALATKQVHASLFVGILIGALFVADGDLLNTFMAFMDSGAMTMDHPGFHIEDWSSWGFFNSLDIGILMFLVILGVFGVIFFKAGGSRAFGNWAENHVKGRKGAMLVTVALGFILFVDDYFNCLTVGSVMRPVTDKFKVSRAKLAYLIDSTAAPICIIAPVSSWAAAVASYTDGFAIDGMAMFTSAIQYNFYALFTIVMIITIILLDFDFGPMKVHEENAKNGDLYTTPDRPYEKAVDEQFNPNGRVFDLLIPIFIFLIPSCIIMLIYTGGFFDGEDFITAFSNCDASSGLAYGSVIALILTVIYFMCRKTITFEDTMESIPTGFSNMVPAILILIFAWTICGITRYGLGFQIFVSGALGDAGALMSLLPAVFMIIACFVAFATGTSWGTFGILLPIVLGMMDVMSIDLLTVSISACLAGAVFGDHCSPVSDTTIMSSAGAQCNHLNHVSTQAPYAILVAAVSFVFFLIAGFWSSPIVTVIGIVAMVAVLVVLKKLQDKGIELFKPKTPVA